MHSLTACLPLLKKWALLTRREFQELDSYFLEIMKAKEAMDATKRDIVCAKVTQNSCPLSLEMIGKY